jgi:hypothetical protein
LKERAFGAYAVGSQRFAECVVSERNRIGDFGTLDLTLCEYAEALSPPDEMKSSRDSKEQGVGTGHDSIALYSIVSWRPETMSSTCVNKSSVGNLPAAQSRAHGVLMIVLPRSVPSTL